MTNKYDKQRQLIRLTLVILLYSSALGVSAAKPQTNDPLADLKLPNTTILSAENLAAGAFKPPAGTTNPAETELFKTLPAARRVVAVIKPASDSNIKFEVWLPIEGWNGKFVAIGNAGFAGSIGYGSIPLILLRGYAVASTDTGHTAPASGGEESWAIGHPESVIDFGYRAIHEMTLKSKAIVKAFYGKAPRYSYFLGCSTGGRQALMEAQRYPEDYDGIVAGAPASDWINLMTHGGYISRAMLSDPANNIPGKKMKAIEAAVISSCDPVDGLKDGLIDDPRQCRFDPSVLLCKGTESDDCLTAPQIEALKKIYGGVRDPNGKQVIPSLVPGGESGPPGWDLWIPGMNMFAGQFFKNMVFEDPKWDMKMLNLERDSKFAGQKLGRILDATNPDLSVFKKRGGKLIMYHGWNDAAIPPEMSINYYKSVVGRFGQRDTDSFLRLFMVPGMLHCALGQGPNLFGQVLGCRPCDAKHDITMALERWVEEGVAPNEIIATKYKNDMVRTDVARTRPLCPFPAVARYKGSGSIDDATNFVCQALKQ